MLYNYLYLEYTQDKNEEDILKTTEEPSVSSLDNENKYDNEDKTNQETYIESRKYYLYYFYCF